MRFERSGQRQVERLVDVLVDVRQHAVHALGVLGTAVLGLMQA
jgi:hypothetical protein